jgi:iron complex outermembrane receptor protein
MKIARSAGSMLALTIALSGWTSAHAQQIQPVQPAADEQADQSTGLAEIVVTAQRRAQNVQDVPIAITAFAGEQLQEQGVLRVETIALRVPGFFAGSFGASRPQLYIRGIGSRQFDPGSEASVGVFVDEVYLGRSSGVLGSLKDIDRVEVLRGPQGTLYGRNTIGGAINIITKGPTDRLSAEAEAGLSNYNGYELFGAIGGPLASNGVLKGRIAAWRISRDGYIVNATTGGRSSGLDNYGGRLKLDFEPSSTIKFSGAVELTRDGNGAAFAGISQGNPINPRAVFLAKPGLTGIIDPDPYVARWNSDPTLDRKIDAYSLKGDFALGGVNLVSISAFRKQRGTESRDVDGSSLDTFSQITSETSDQFTQELRLSSDKGGALTFNDHLSWILGAFYYHDKSSFVHNAFLGSDSVVNLLNGGRNAADTVSGEYKTESYAAFGQVTWLPIEKVEITAGVRYSKDDKSARYIGTTSAPGLPVIAAPFNTGVFKKSWSSVDPRLVATYHFNHNVNVYASYSKGFKSGGFQFSPFSDAAARSIFDPEKLRAFEIGLKSTLLDRRLRLNMSAFDYKYTDLQVSAGVVATTNGSVVNVITNAASSTVRGAEIEAVISPSDSIEINLAYAYLDAKYDNYVFNPPGVPITAASDFSGTALVRAPKHSISAGGQWTVPVGSDELRLRADYSYRSTFFHEPGEGNAIYGVQTPLTREAGYGLLDLRATFTHAAWSLSAYVTNLTKTRYRRTENLLSNVVVGYPGEPRIFGAKIRWRY